MDHTFENYKMETFLFKERTARVIYPNCEGNGRLIWKAEYWNAFPDFEIEMLNRGYFWCNLEHATRWAPDEETAISAEFIKFVANKLEIEPKCIPVGMSCGGLQVLRLAELYPDLVSVLYLDAPVVNILSMVGLGEAEFNPDHWRELVSTYGFSKSTVVNFRKSPIDAMNVLIEHDIPIIMLYGNADNTVIYEENGKALEDYYLEHGGTMKVISRSMCAHHPHGLKDPRPIINFIETHIR
ncbi:MAG TPA: hypothetical protein DDZ89_10940 [Clostridiales bacterium]|nr:hypothetical protein [Clostridiales bacterium]